jgi:hypothetical protein
VILNPFSDLPHFLAAGPDVLQWSRSADDPKYGLALWLIDGRDL